MKAFLTWQDQPFRRTHDLVELTQQCVHLEPALSGVLRGLGPLTRFAWETRYPGEAEPPTVELARTWVTKVREVLDALEGLIPPASSA